MKLLIATPCYGGMLTSRYLQSMIQTVSGLMNDEIEFAVFNIENESLISRGRNVCAMHALEHGYDKLMFIDADMIWKYEDLKRLIQSDKKIIGGTYPLKAFPITLNLNPLPNKGGDVFSDHRQLDNYKELARKYADPNGELEVKHIPTGFMLIDCEVFAKLSYTVETYANFDPVNKVTKQYFDFFPSGAKNGQFESEDWAFCRLAREAGFSIYLNVKSVTGHTGIHHYQLGQHVILGQQPLINP